MSQRQLEAALQRAEHDNHELRREVARLRAERDRQAKAGAYIPDAYTHALIHLHDVAFYGAPRSVEEARIREQKPGSRPPVYDSRAYRKYLLELEKLGQTARRLEEWVAHHLRQEPPLAS